MNPFLTPLAALFAWKVRGFRVVEIAGVVMLAAMVFSTYVAKAGAASQSAQVSALETQIAAEHQRVRLLRTEVARLEQPARLEALSRAAGLEPVAVTNRAAVTALPEIAPERPQAQPAPHPAPQAALQPAVDAEAVPGGEAPQ
jgi:hypothetical protein